MIFNKRIANFITALVLFKSVSSYQNQRVHFDSNGMSLAGDLYLPDEISNAPLPAVVVGHPMGSVKEQTAGLYARQLADEGFVTLAFDAAHNGESEGTPRYLENPYQRANDFKNAVSYLSTLNDIVDADRIGGLGICASGGYIPFAAQTDKRIKAVATVSAFDYGRSVREPWGGGPIQYDSLNEQLAQSSQNLTNMYNGAPPTLIFQSYNDSSEIPPDAPITYFEWFDYYRTPRAFYPTSNNLRVAESVDFAATYNSYQFNDFISPRPLLMVAGDIAETLYYSQEGFDRALEPKELFLVPNATHVDLYDHTDVSLPKIADFMRTNL